jgi:hypothetical protein
MASKEDDSATMENLSLSDRDEKAEAKDLNAEPAVNEGELYFANELVSAPKPTLYSSFLLHYRSVNDRSRDR